MVGADVSVDDGAGQKDAAEVGQGVFVVVGGDGASVLSRLNPRSTVFRSL